MSLSFCAPTKKKPNKTNNDAVCAQTSILHLHLDLQDVMKVALVSPEGQ